MKKLAAIAVLLVFLFNTMGYFVVFQCQETLNKREMFSQIRKGLFHPDIVLLKIHRPDKDKGFRRIEKREFSYNGSMYDIVVERKYGDTTCFYCLHDKKEEKLLAEFNMHLRHHGSPRPDSPIPSLLNHLITQALIQNALIHYPDQGTCLRFTDIQEPVFHVFLVPYAPPPEMA